MSNINWFEENGTWYGEAVASSGMKVLVIENEPEEVRNTSYYSVYAGDDMHIVCTRARLKKVIQLIKTM